MALKYLNPMDRLMKNYRLIKRMIEADTQLLKDFSYIKGTNYEGVNVSPTNKFNSSTENMMIKKNDIEARLLANKRKIRLIDAAIELLDPIERDIITQYYIKDYGWVSVALNLHMSTKQCQRKRDEALTKMSKYIFLEEIDKESGNTQLVLKDIRN